MITVIAAVIYSSSKSASETFVHNKIIIYIVF